MTKTSFKSSQTDLMLLIITVTIITVEARKFFVKIKQKIDFWRRRKLYLLLKKKMKNYLRTWTKIAPNLPYHHNVLPLRAISLLYKASLMLNCHFWIGHTRVDTRRWKEMKLLVDNCSLIFDSLDPAWQHRNFPIKNWQQWTLKFYSIMSIHIGNPHLVWKSPKMSHSTLRAKRATFTF